MGYKHVLGNSSMQHNNLWFQNEFFQKKFFGKYLMNFETVTNFWHERNIILEKEYCSRASQTSNFTLIQEKFQKS